MSHPESPSDSYPSPSPYASSNPYAQPAEAAAPVPAEQPAPSESTAAPEPTAVLPAPAAPTAPLPEYPAGPAAPAYQAGPAYPAGPAYQAGQAPVSGPAYPVASGVPYPTSSFPATGVPAAQPAPAKRGRTAVILLSTLSGLLVLGLIGMTTLFVVSAGQAKKKEDTLTAQLNAANRELSNTKLDLQAKASDLSKLQQDLDGSKAATAEQAKEKEAVGKCLDLIYKVLSARTLSDFNKRLKAADKPCDEADKYVDSF
jgi:Skp family chaperone for outer membrane proteins